MSQQPLELNHLASTSRLPSLPLEGRTPSESHHDLNRHPVSASVIFPVEIWLSILGNLALRDLYSLTVTSKFFYNNFTSIYRTRVAQEGIPVPKRLVRPTSTRTPCFFMLVYAVSLIGAILAGMLIAKSPDLSHTACCIYIVIACCCTFKLADIFLSSFSSSTWSSKYRAFGSWAVWWLLWLASIIIGHVVLANNDCISNPIESRRATALYCRLWKPVLAFAWIEWALTMASLCYMSLPS